MTAPIRHQAYIRAMNRITRDNETLHRSEDHTYERLECGPMKTIDDFMMTHNADDAYFDRMYEDKPTPYRDLIRNNPTDWDEFVESHLSAYPDFKKWVYNFQHKGQAPLESLKRIIERAIKDMES